MKNIHERRPDLEIAQAAREGQENGSLQEIFFPLVLKNTYPMDNSPRTITETEWKEIVAFGPVREAWGLEDDSNAEEFASRVYGARFYFTSGGPGYVGDIYILQGDALSEVPPLVLGRDPEGRLIVC